MSPITKMRHVPSKLPDVGTTIFTVMSRLAAEHAAINLSQGYPDFSPPARLIELAGIHMRAGTNQYAPMAGWPALREAVAQQVHAIHGRRICAETEITVTAGGTEAIFSAVQAVVHPGDEVILLEPAYDSYEPAVQLAGGVAVRIPLLRPQFDVDWQRVRAAVSPRTRLVIVNTPHNPSGAVFSHDDLESLASVLRGTDALVLADEVYEHMVYDGARHHGILGHAELAGRAMVVSSLGKTYHATGWKVGYCVAPAELTRELRKVHQFVQFSVATPLQAAFADYMTEASGHRVQLAAFYQARRDHFCRLLGRTRFRCRPCAGTYFQLADYSAVSDLPDVEFARQLTIEHGVAAIPVSVFSSSSSLPSPPERMVRFCFAKDDATLDAAGERLARI